MTMIRPQGEFPIVGNDNMENDQSTTTTTTTVTTTTMIRSEAEELAPQREPTLQRLQLQTVDRIGDVDEQLSSHYADRNSDVSQLARAAMTVSADVAAAMHSDVPSHCTDLLQQLAESDDQARAALRERSLARRAAASADSLGLFSLHLYLYFYLIC